jgi:hypothetical protein
VIDLSMHQGVIQQHHYAYVHVTLNSRSEPLRVQVFGLPIAALVVAIDSHSSLLTKKGTGYAKLHAARRAPIPRIANCHNVGSINGQERC